MTLEAPTQTTLSAAILARVLLRCAAVLMMAIGVWGIVVNIAEALPGFDPNFPGYFFWAEVFRPFSLWFLGLAIWLCAGWFSRLVSRS